ncbi:hypothetical protein CFN78_20815 [Amycolatopsis antarctica]|uniref:Uncharacterized protein n=1 Tax=Amycolatopsis antarctica TaxID=1854586 RepID=A0A263D1M1_9PSEU|nr:hypothetical protein CFN78_20815 [Amycolatopsis antarctica]
MLATAVVVTGCATPGAEQTAAGLDRRHQTIIDGPQRPEDLIAVPASTWVVSSGVPHGTTTGRLQGVNSTDSAIVDLWPANAGPARPDRETYPDCPGPPDAQRFSPHGLDLVATGPGVARLLVVNHGGREAVEVFDVDTASSPPLVSWRGCAVLPETVGGNGVAALPDGSGFVATNAYDSTKPPDYKAIIEGRSSGDVRLWQRGTGWTTVPFSALPGPNGVAVSADSKTAYVADWPSRRIVAIPVAGGLPKTVASLKFLPDNLRTTVRGTILTTGQDITAEDLGTCGAGEGPDCPPGFSIVEINPGKGKTKVVYRSEDPEFGMATTAAPVGNEIWVGRVGKDRIARVSP